MNTSFGALQVSTSTTEYTGPRPAPYRSLSDNKPPCIFSNYGHPKNNARSCNDWTRALQNPLLPDPRKHWFKYICNRAVCMSSALRGEIFEITTLTAMFVMVAGCVSVAPITVYAAVPSQTLDNTTFTAMSPIEALCALPKLPE